MARVTESTSRGSKASSKPPANQAKSRPAKAEEPRLEGEFSLALSPDLDPAPAAKLRRRYKPSAAYQMADAKITPLTIYRATPTERMGVIKHGVPAVEAKRFLTGLGIHQVTVLKALALPTATMNKKVKLKANLSPADSERVVGLAKLVGQVEAMVRESGNPEGFDAAAWMSRWMQQPQPALDGERPIDMLDTMEGQSVVSTVLAQMQSGAYA